MAGIKEVAKKSGVSMTTISRFLNQDSTLSIAEETKKNIIAAIEYYDYKPNQNRKRINRNIGLLNTKSEIGELEDPFFRSIRIGILEEVQEKKLNIKINQVIGETQNLEELRNLSVVLIVGELDNDYIDEISQYNANLVFINDRAAPKEFDAVFPDIEGVTREYLDMLYKAGHRNIVYVGGKIIAEEKLANLYKNTEDIRYKTYLEWMEKNGLAHYSKGFIGEWGINSAVDLTQEIIAHFQDKEFPTVLISASDPMTMGVYKVLNEHGIKIPQDVSVVSYDDTDVAEYMIPSLTSANLRQQEMGRIGVRLAWERVMGERTIPIKVCIPAEIITIKSIRQIKM